MNGIFNTVLLASLPAAGKTAIRTFLRQADTKLLREEFHFGEYVAIDDFPYVIFINRIDEELAALGRPGIFYPNGQSYYDSREYGALALLVSEDYSSFLHGRQYAPPSAARYLFERIDAAGERVGLGRRISALEGGLRQELAGRMEAQARELVEENNRVFSAAPEGKTVVLEFSRGGPEGAAMPLTGAEGYQYSLPLLNAELLERLRILYIKISPAESFRKNFERPFHIPEGVMRRNYGCDDMLQLLGGSDVLELTAHGRSYRIPTGIFDSESVDLSFLYKPQEEWRKEEYESFCAELKKAAETMCGK